MPWNPTITDVMIVTHLSTYETGGGAAIAADRLHRGLQCIGVDSRFLVGRKSSDDETVITLPTASHPVHRCIEKMRARAIQSALARYDGTRPKHFDYFSDDRAPNSKAIIRALGPTDIVNLHWVAGFADYRRVLPNVGSKPLIWTLHDMNPFTGGCHYTTGCKKFAAECGACPQLGSADAHDLAWQIFRRKRAALSCLSPERVRIVTPSTWLESAARNSGLFGRFSVTTIPNGLDIDTFQPRDKAVAREVFGIPQCAKVLLFSAQSLKEQRKGMDCLVAALAEMGGVGEICLLTVGSGKPPAGLKHRCVAAGGLRSERLLSFAYSAADVYVCPTREDNLPNVVVEAFACGTPVVAFDVGGIPDMVRSGVTGFLVPPEDVLGLAKAISDLLADDALRARMAQKCRRIAVAEYSLPLQARRYKQLYEDVIAATGASRNFVPT